MSSLSEIAAEYREIQRVSGLKGGHYLLNGRPAWCRVTLTGVSINYDDGSYTSMNHDTFKKWFGANPPEA